ncbi:MAG: diguanylate cyclase [Elusimicrobia bacterium]|nr:diguanylate cyclase [Elusimicrobiota bacterium]
MLSLLFVLAPLLSAGAPADAQTASDASSAVPAAARQISVLRDAVRPLERDYAAAVRRPVAPALKELGVRLAAVEAAVARSAPGKAPKVRALAKSAAEASALEAAFTAPGAQVLPAASAAPLVKRVRDIASAYAALFPETAWTVGAGSAAGVPPALRRAPDAPRSLAGASRAAVDPSRYFEGVSARSALADPRAGPAMLSSHGPAMLASHGPAAVSARPTPALTNARASFSAGGVSRNAPAAVPAPLAARVPAAPPAPTEATACAAALSENPTFAKMCADHPTIAPLLAGVVQAFHDQFLTKEGLLQNLLFMVIGIALAAMSGFGLVAKLVTSLISFGLMGWTIWELLKQGGLAALTIAKTDKTDARHAGALKEVGNVVGTVLILALFAALGYAAGKSKPAAGAMEVMTNKLGEALGNAGFVKGAAAADAALPAGARAALARLFPKTTASATTVAVKEVAPPPPPGSVTRAQLSYYAKGGQGTVYRVEGAPDVVKVYDRLDHPATQDHLRTQKEIHDELAAAGLPVKTVPVDVVAVGEGQYGLRMPKVEGRSLEAELSLLRSENPRDPRIPQLESQAREYLGRVDALTEARFGKPLADRPTNTWKAPGAEDFSNFLVTHDAAGRPTLINIDPFNMGRYTTEMARGGIKAPAPSPAELLARFEAKDPAQARAARAALETDAMTGVPNRAYVERVAPAKIRAVAAEGGRPTVAMLDMNNFGAVNEGLSAMHGPTAGAARADAVLVKASARLKGLAGQYGVEFGRFGGEEFVVIGDRASVHKFMEASRAEFANGQALRDAGLTAEEHTAIQRAAEKKGRGDQSIGDFTAGVAPAAPAGEFANALHAADEALNFAKQNGGRGHAFEPGAAPGAPAFGATPAALSGPELLEARALKYSRDRRATVRDPNVADRMAELKEKLGPEGFAEFSQVAFRDGLTGARTKEYLAAKAPEWKAKYPEGAPASMVSARGLKMINDALGHEAGDAYLAALGRVVREAATRGRLEDPVRYASKDFLFVGDGSAAAADQAATAMAALMRGEGILGAAQKAKLAEWARANHQEVPADLGTLRAVSASPSDPALAAKARADANPVAPIVDALVHLLEETKAVEQGVASPLPPLQPTMKPSDLRAPDPVAAGVPDRGPAAGGLSRAPAEEGAAVPEPRYNSPNSRHRAQRVVQGSTPKSVNTVAEPWVPMAEHARAMNMGEGVHQVDGKTYRVSEANTPSGRVLVVAEDGPTPRVWRYGVHEKSYHPIDGPGMHVLTRGEYKVLGMYNEMGIERANPILDKMGYSKEDRAKPFAVWTILHPGAQ